MHVSGQSCQHNLGIIGMKSIKHNTGMIGKVCSMRHRFHNFARLKSLHGDYFTLSYSYYSTIQLLDCMNLLELHFQMLLCCIGELVVFKKVRFHKL